MRRLKAVKSVKENVSLLRTSVRHQTREFFDNSTLHGIRYIAEEDRSFSEKFMWFSFVAIGAVAAFVIIGSLWEKFQTNPTITGKVLKYTQNFLSLFIQVRIESS